MKVGSSSSIGGARGAGQASRSSSAAGSGFASELAGTGGAGGITGGAAIGASSAIIALQSVGTGPVGERRARERATLLLDLLDEVRIGLLDGGLPERVLHDLARVIGRTRGQIQDPGLGVVLDEIELRARVELAKFEMSRDRPL